MMEGCWGDDPGEGLTEILKFLYGEGRRIYFVSESWG